MKGPLTSLLGAPGEAPTCKVWAKDVSVHWYDGDATTCLCGAATRDQARPASPKEQTDA